MRRDTNMKPSGLIITEVANGYSVLETAGNSDCNGRTYGDETHVFACATTLSMFVQDYYTMKVNHEPRHKKE